MQKIERTIKSVQALYLVYILRKGIIPANHNSDSNNKFVHILPHELGYLKIPKVFF